MWSVVCRSSLRFVPLLVGLMVSFIPMAGSAAQAAGCPLTGCTPITPVIGPAQQLISNGGFEEPFNYPNWTLSGSQYDAGNGHAHCGPTSLAFHETIYQVSGLQRAVPSTATQSVAIPATANGVDLDLWANFAPTTLHQLLDVQVGTPGTNFTPIVRFDSSNVGTGSWKHLGPIDLSMYKGQTISLRLQGWTATPLWSFMLDAGTFYVDDVALWTGSHLLLDRC